MIEELDEFVKKLCARRPGGAELWLELMLDEGDDTNFDAMIRDFEDDRDILRQNLEDQMDWLAF